MCATQPYHAIAVLPSLCPLHFLVPTTSRLVRAPASIVHHLTSARPLRPVPIRRFEKYYGAMNRPQFKGSCGKCVRVRGTESGATGKELIVKIVDGEDGSCPIFMHTATRSPAPCDCDC